MKKNLYYCVKTVSTILTAAVVIVCLICGYLLYCSIAKMDVPTLGPYQIYVVLSDSMYPVMKTDDAVIISKTEPEKLKVQDIITFRAFESDTIITHRIIAVNQTADGYEFNTKGDNNNVQDSFVTPGSRIIGKYMFKIPSFGSFISGMNEKPYMVAIPVAVLMAIQFLLGICEDKLNPNPKKKKNTKLDSDETVESEIEQENDKDSK